MLQHGQPHLLSQHHQQVGSRNSGPEPFVAHRPRWDSVGPPTGRQRPHQPGQVERDAGSELPGPEHGGEDQGVRLRGVFVSHSEEPEGDV